LDQISILSHLEALAHKLGIEIRYEHLEAETGFMPGGLCRIKGKQVVIINSDSHTEAKVRTLAKALGRFDLGEVYVRPALRELLEYHGKEGG